MEEIDKIGWVVSYAFGSTFTTPLKFHRRGRTLLGCNLQYLEELKNDRFRNFCEHI